MSDEEFEMIMEERRQFWVWFHKKFKEIYQPERLNPETPKGDAIV